MAFLFWLLWIINVLVLVLAVIGKGFRSSFGAGVDLNNLVIVGILTILIVSLLFKFSGKPRWISLLIVSLPVICMLVVYFFEKITGKSI